MRAFPFVQSTRSKKGQTALFEIETSLRGKEDRVVDVSTASRDHLGSCWRSSLYKAEGLERERKGGGGGKVGFSRDVYGRGCALKILN